MARTRSQPSHYPPLAFHAIRFCALISSLVVAAFLSFFVYHLKHDGFRLPWTFLVLFAVSILSLLTLALTFTLHLCHVLSPLLNMVINILLSVLWLLGLALLGWNMAGTLGHVCNSSNWGSDAGIMVCRIYKALFTFTLFGTISSIAMAVLDGKVRRRQTSLGKYNQMHESYDLKPTRDQFGSEALDRHHEQPVAAWQREGHEPSDYHSRGQSQSTIRSSHFGYVSPAEQTHYDSGIYGHGDRM